MATFSPLKISVRTESGQQLGHVVDVTIEPDTQSIIAYHVKQNRLVPAVVNSPLIIHRTQVISINDKEMVVDDTAGKVRRPATAPLPTN